MPRFSFMCLGFSAGTSNLVVIETPVPVEDRRDYLNFALPSFGCYEELLSRGTPISGPVQRAIVDKLFQECFKLAWYSSRELYRTAAERLVQTYPHLADKLGAKTSGLESWVLSLRNKFKNMWKKVENCPPEMAEKRAQSLHKRPRQPQGDVLNKKLCRLFLLLEFDILDKKNVVDEFSQGCQNLCDLALRNGDDIEVAKFSKAAGDNPILSALEFAAARCNEALHAILLEVSTLELNACQHVHVICTNDLIYAAEHCLYFIFKRCKKKERTPSPLW
ncbi:uncharacterized protein LOC142785326 isoform X2 [Rhipicephalus microplus]|uniref:uncharacterized protein LOC142785326 isoform X2 n=1 Tax=Rhipicephalus microplus TaxID=6941 RepID=UPI003F6D2812